MLNSKYSKVLTVILVISIIAIIALLIFIGIDLYKAHTTNSDVKDFDDEFESFIGNNIGTNETPEDNQNNEGTNNEIIEPDLPEDLNTPTTSGNSGSGSSSSSSENKLPLYKGFNVVGRIEIPKINVKYYLLEEYSPKALETSVVVIYGPGPNQVGNTVIAGHNYRNGTFFSNNKKLTNGDKIYITDLQGKKVTYEISRHYTTNENDFSYAVRDTNGKRAISLTTCTDDSKNRLIIWAEEV